MNEILMSLISIRKFDLFDRIWKATVYLSEGSACNNFTKSILIVANSLRHEWSLCDLAKYYNKLTLNGTKI